MRVRVESSVIPFDLSIVAPDKITRLEQACKEVSKILNFSINRTKAKTPDKGAKSKACLACGLTFGFACHAMESPAASSMGMSLEPSPIVMSSESSIPCCSA